MLNISSPILIFGDVSLSKNIITSAKTRYKDVRWDIVSATNSDLDEIRMIAGFNGFDSNEKIVLIEDLPNKKAVRDFILDLIKTTDKSVKFIIWDSNGHMKMDPKTKTMCKSWSDFYSAMLCTTDSKVIDSGSNFTDKEDVNCVKFIQDGFRQFNKTIDNRTAIIFSDIVGKNRGLLLSEIRKIAVNSPDILTEDFIIENTFPTSSEAVLYKLGNVIDSCNFHASISMLDDFLSRGISPYLIAEILLRKARWQLAVMSLWSAGSSFNNIVDEIMDMGRFPSNVWHGNYDNTSKKYSTISCPDLKSKVSYMTEKLGLPEYFFNSGNRSKKDSEDSKESKDSKDSKDEKSEKSEKGDSGEVIPMRFMAQQIVDFVKVKIIEKNKKYLENGNECEFKSKMTSKMMDNYLNILDQYKNIRYNQKDSVYVLHEMIKTIINFDLLV